MKKSFFNNARYYMDISYGNGTPTCTCGDDYCRCSTVSDLEIHSVDIDSLIREVLPAKAPLINKYCIDRLFRLHRLYDPSKWEIEIEPGYYGEELGICRFDHQEQVIQDIHHALNLKTIQAKVEYLLEQEYGYILDKLKGLRYSIGKIDRNHIYLKDELRKKPRDTLYEDYKLPVCVVLKISKDLYRLIDGHHRFLQSKNQKVLAIIGHQKKDCNVSTIPAN